MLILFLTLLIPFIHAKTNLGQVQLTGESTEAFLGKFAFNLNKNSVKGDGGTLEATFWTETPYLENSRSLNLYLFCDEEWEKAKTVYTCVEKAKLARETLMLDMNAAGTIDLKKEIQTKSYSTTIDGAAFVNTTLDHYIRSHYWYAFVADCSLEMYNHKVPPIYYNVTFLNAGGNHLPADEKGLWEIHLFSLVLMSVGLLVVVLRTWKTIGETKSIHLVVLLLCLAISASVSYSEGERASRIWKAL